MLEVLLIRHGQTDWNVERRIMGHRPIPLNRRGQREAKLIAKALARIPVDAIFSSPFLRAIQTATIISKNQKKKPIVSHEVAEIHYGDWIGKKFEEVSSEKAFQIYHQTPRKAQAPGGEKMTSVQKRAVKFVESLRKKYQKGRVVVVSHADVIKSILVHYLGLDLNELLRFRVDNASLSFLLFNGTRSRVLALNCPATAEQLFASTDQLLPKRLAKRLMPRHKAKKT